MQSVESTTGTLAIQLPYKIIKDGNNLEHKVIDFDHEDMVKIVPKSGQLVFETIRKSTRLPVEGYSHSLTRDILSEVLVGINTGVHPKTKELTWQRLSLGKINTYDLSIAQERKRAIVLLYSYIVEGSPNLSQNSKLHVFRVHDAEKAAHLEIKRIEDGQNALMIARGLYGEDLFNMARNMGIMPETTSLPILTAEVLKVAEKRPQEFLQMWHNPNRELITVLKRCMDTGIVSFDSLAGYNYTVNGTNITFLGHNEPSVLEFFKKYPDVATTLDVKSREKLKQSEKAMSKAAPVTLVSSDKEAEIQILRKQLADATAKLEQQSVNAIRNSADEIETNVELELTLEKLKTEASELGLGKGLHHYKPTEDSIGKLRAKIEEAKATA